MTGLAPTVTLARLYEKQGFLGKAARVYRQLIAIDQDKPGLKEALEEIERSLKSKKVHYEEPESKKVLSKLMKWQEAVNNRKTALDEPRKKDTKIIIIYGQLEDTTGSREGVSLSNNDAVREVDRDIEDAVRGCSVKVDTFQSNDEKILARKINEASHSYDALIINPVINSGAFTYDSELIRQALSMLEIPVIEIYLSNIYHQNPFKKSVIADVVAAQLVGFGKESYSMAVHAAAEMVSRSL
jgi:3-dehydroquinate dehydratase-2